MKEVNLDDDTKDFTTLTRNYYMSSIVASKDFCRQKVNLLGIPPNTPFIRG